MSSTAEIAQRRSLEAELATDAATEEAGAEGHQQASQLHREAADWQKRNGRERRAGLHTRQAKIHAQAAAQLSDA